MITGLMPYAVSLTNPTPPPVDLPNSLNCTAELAAGTYELTVSVYNTIYPVENATVAPFYASGDAALTYPVPEPSPVFGLVVIVGALAVKLRPRISWKTRRPELSDLFGRSRPGRGKTKPVSLN